MADFFGCLSSTSFRVRDIEAFLADPETEWLRDHATEDGFFEEEDGYFAFGWYGQYPDVLLKRWREEQEEEVEEELDILELIHRHILPGDVCQIGVSGNEDFRYIGGNLWWVSSDGISGLCAETAWDARLTLATFQKLITPRKVASADS